MAKTTLRPLTGALLLAATLVAAIPAAAQEWTGEELGTLRSLWIGSLPPVPPDPTNRVADDPQAAGFGHRLFFDTRLSANGRVSCATCHDPARAFTDGLKVSKGVGATSRNAPTVIAAAYSPWQFWDGRKDSLWAQALGPMESPVEHGMDRGRIVDVVRRDAGYRRRYRALFGPLAAADDVLGTDRAFANLGKAIAAYERRLVPGPSRFDRYVAALLDGREPAPADRLSVDEEMGLRVFITPPLGNCIRCHKGPLFTDHRFHNVGVEDGGTPADAAGRLTGMRSAQSDEFRCDSRFSDAPESGCATLRAATDPAQKPTDMTGAFKTPTLRNAARTAPYMHTGAIPRLEDVTWHYRTRPAATVGTTELDEMTITATEFDQIEAFLRTLDGPVAAPARYLKPPARE
jgi:cytochrome c peroxidase